MPEAGCIAGFFDQLLKFTLREGVEEFDVSSPFENLDVLPAHARLDELPGKLESRDKIYTPRKGLQPLAETYRDIWIDTPPTLNFDTRSTVKVREPHQASRPMVRLEPGHKLPQEFEALFDTVLQASGERRSTKR